MSDTKDKYSTIHYYNYLQLDKLLGAQVPRSGTAVEDAAHDETLFIIIHQVYELWFKQIAHELRSVIDLFDRDRVDEKNIGMAVARLQRVIEIQKVLIGQVRVLETMTPLDFLDFRSYLFPASGFQSFQFRIVEVLLGLQEKDRLSYNNHRYASVFPEPQQRELEALQNSGTLFAAVESWLERTPFLQFGDFDFLRYYRRAVEAMLAREQEAIRDSDYLSESEKAMRLRMLGSTDTYFESVLDPEVHERLHREGKMRLSYRATVAALLINLYRDEPILHGPYQMLVSLIDIDELFTTWRYRHAQMVLRMLGRKIGTGGSSGHEYLRETALRHQIYTDLHNISTLLIPRSELPELPIALKKELGFYFSHR
ncbi:MAG: tryptophan 2,3-dioxygenase family protein [Bacteroidota bacterium]